MALDRDKIRRVIHSLSKSLRRNSHWNSPEDVHDLRTRSRRLEALVHALALDKKNPGRDLLKSIAHIRKQAGHVRDMDVLTALIPTLVLSPDDPSLVQLVEHLGAARKKQAQKLRATITTYRKPTLRGLKRCASTLDKADEAAWQQSQSAAAAAALQLAAEAAAMPRLTAASVHRYRIKLKALRYTLQLAEGDTPPFVRAIEQVTDAIGTWHDWTALHKIVSDLFDPTEAHPLLKLISTTQSAKLHQALASAAALQKKYLNAAANNRSTRKFQAHTLNKQALASAAKLAS